ncbi:hypothetical protein EMIT0P258_120212 [Pseudomonas sp. IT-P258]
MVDLPPCRLGLHFGGRARSEVARQVDRRLDDRRGASGQGEGDRSGKGGRNDEPGRALGPLQSCPGGEEGQWKGSWKSRHRIGLVWIRDGISVGPGVREVVSEGSPFGRHVERSFMVEASLADGIGRALTGRRREVRVDRLQQLFGRRKLALTSGDQVFEAAHEGAGRGIAAQLQDVRATIGVLGFRVQTHHRPGGKKVRRQRRPSPGTSRKRKVRLRSGAWRSHKSVPLALQPDFAA